MYKVGDIVIFNDFRKVINEARKTYRVKIERIDRQLELDSKLMMTYTVRNLDGGPDKFYIYEDEIIGGKINYIATDPKNIPSEYK